ncbi:hypothetical protein BG006_002345 [Podila minutissima]|uniref:dolichyl-phosphate-mannose--protein mannosyltransferase n=1 Tax=Podila minutissima TaxID=64525 RepID=A0A9P5SRH1_9FUNG|nr:hypothetical protein BG006_002345 [Podila minutissima]
MTKRNKKKTPSNITAQSAFVSEGQSSSNAREPSETLSTSTSAATLTASVPNSPQPPSQLRARGLEDLDHSDDEDTPLNTKNGKTAMKSLTKKQLKATKEASMSASSSWTPAARETSDFTTSLWVWLTASRAVSELQLEHESKGERARKAVRGQKQAALLGVASLGEQEPLLTKNKNKDTGGDKKDLEKKNAKYSWDRAKMPQAPDLTGRDWAALSALTVATLGVRLWRISWPDEVVLDEVHMGRHINGYIKNEFTFDPHPPLGKLLLAGVSFFADYSGSFAFDEIGDAFPGSTPYVSMRLVMALMGALCSPMAYVTLKATGQSAPAAIVAGTLVAFDNALTANNRLFLLDAPLMFFVAATFMSWNMFIKQSPRPFTAIWWAWLLATGLSMAGAMSTKLAGVFTVAVVGMISSVNLWRLARDDSMNAKTWTKHVGARFATLILLPAILYLALFHLHFSLQLYQPDIRTSPQAEHELDLIPRAYRHSLCRKYFSTEEERYDYEDEEVWADVVYGSVIQLQSEYDNPGTFLHSFNKWSPVGSHQQQVAGYSYPDLNTHWIVVRGAKDEWEKEEIPSRIQYLKNDDILRLRHVPTRKCLHSHELHSIGEPHNKQLCEVTAYGEAEFDGDENDWWIVEVIDEATQTKLPWQNKSKVKALESLVRLKHYSLGCHLMVSENLLPYSWGEGRRELVCRKDARVNAKSTWRITMNDHDNLPMDTELASYPVMTYWKKFVLIHKLMLDNPDINARTYQPSASRPLRWPIAQSMIPAWAGYKRQLTIVANPVVWWTGTLGVLAFLAAKALFLLREKRGYFETGRVGELKNYHLNDAAVYFVGWATHYVPFIFIHRTLFMHHYFPSLYLSILLASSLFSGLAGFLPRKARFALLVTILALAISVFVRLSPLSYASAMTREHCESLSPLVNSLLTSDDNRLDCSHAPPASAQPTLLSEMKAQARREKAIYSKKALVTSTTTTSAAVAENTQSPPSQQQQQLLQQHKGYPPIPVSAPGAPPIEFLTAEAPQDALERHQQNLRNRDAHLPEALRSWGGAQVRITRVEPKAKAPVLPMHFPLANETLPVEGVFLTPYQRPPQRWDLDLEEEAKEEEAAAAKEEEKSKKEESGDGDDDEDDEDDEEASYAEQAQGSSNHDRDSSAPVMPGRQDEKMLQGDNEQQIDRLLEEYKARNRAERRVRVAVAQNQYEHAHAPPPPLEDAAQERHQKGQKNRDDNEPENTMGIKAKEEEEVKEEPNVLKPEAKKDSAAYAGDHEISDEDVEYEVRGPPIRVGSPEELDKVLKQLQAEGVRAEVVRGSVTHTIEPPDDGSSDEYDDNGSYEDAQEYVLEEYDGEGESDDNDDDDDDSPRPPPIAVNNAEELASVLDKLAAEGIRAEVVRGTATRYVEPPSATGDVEE